MNLQNIEIHNYHGYCVAYYDSSGYRTGTFNNVVHNNVPPNCVLKPFDLLIVDEAQDMTEMYFRFIYKIFER